MRWGFFLYTRESHVFQKPMVKPALPIPEHLWICVQVHGPVETPKCFNHLIQTVRIATFKCATPHIDK